jgi:hypothetical protein
MSAKRFGITHSFEKCLAALLLSLTLTVGRPCAQTQELTGASARPQASPSPTRANILRGQYGRYRANNDLLFYHLDVRVDPEKKFLSGKNTIRFRMLKDDSRIQLDLHEALKVDKILFQVSAVGGLVPGSKARVNYERDSGAVFVDFPETLHAGQDYEIDFYYSGNPLETGRFGGIAFRKDPKGRPWISTACEGEGCKYLMAQQGPMARRSRVDGDQRGFRTTWLTFQTKVPGQNRSE